MEKTRDPLYFISSHEIQLIWLRNMRLSSDKLGTHLALILTDSRYSVNISMSSPDIPHLCAPLTSKACEPPSLQSMCYFACSVGCTHSSIDVPLKLQSELNRMRVMSMSSILRTQCALTVAYLDNDCGTIVRHLENTLPTSHTPYCF